MAPGNIAITLLHEKVSLLADVPPLLLNTIELWELEAGATDCESPSLIGTIESVSKSASRSASHFLATALWRLG